MASTEILGRETLDFLDGIDFLKAKDFDPCVWELLRLSRYTKDLESMEMFINLDHATRIFVFRVANRFSPGHCTGIIKRFCNWC